MGEGHLGLAQHHAEAGQVEGAEEGRGHQRRVHRRADVVAEPLERQRLGARPAPDGRRALEHLDAVPRPGQGERCGQAVGPRAHHDRVRPLHGPTLPIAIPGCAGRSRVLGASAGAPPARSIGCAAGDTGSAIAGSLRRNGGSHGRGPRNLRPALRRRPDDAGRPDRDGRRPRGVGRRLPARRAGRRHLGRLGRRREDAALGARHHHQRLVDHQDDDVPVRAHAARPRRARLPRPRGHLLARVRRQRQGARRGAPRHGPHRRPLGLGRALAGRAAGRLGPVHEPARRPGAVVGARHRLGLPRRDAGLPHRRDRPAHHRRDDRSVVRPRGGQAARCRLPHRPARRARTTGSPT